MNKTLFCIVSAGILFMQAEAQGRNVTVEVHKANNTSGKVLTMEETILSGNIRPHKSRFAFDDKGGVVKLENAASGRPSIFKADEGFSNFTESPEKSFVAYTCDNSIYFRSKEGKDYIAALSEGDDFVYGQSVSRNEFNINGGIFWSPDGSKLAFYRKDESRVADFPLVDLSSGQFKARSIKYPMAGTESEFVQVGVYDLIRDTTYYLKTYDFETDRYLTNVTWSPDSELILIQILDRSQKHMHLNAYHASDGMLYGTVLMEDNDRFVEPEDPVWFLKGSNDTFFYRTDNRDGYKNIYLCNLKGDVRRITTCKADVTYVGNDGDWLYYMSAEVSPVENHLFKVPISGKGKKKGAVRLTRNEGWHEVTLSPDFKSFIDSYSSLNNPGTVEHRSTADGKLIRLLEQCPDPTTDYAYTETELGTVKSADGLYDNWYRLIKPIGFNPQKKYPVIVYVYGGPHSQMVQNTWYAQIRWWEMYMAQRGYIVYVQDNRGTRNRGAEYEKAIYGQCGQCEMADQMEGVKMLMSLPYVDKDRIGVHGWSYGGFMTISLLTNYPDVFKVAVAGGPVIDWRWYEVMYGERYMSTPQLNPEGYEKTSLMNKIDGVQGKLLICQGVVDKTVVWQHCMSFIQACIDRNVPVDFFAYPYAEHNVYGKNRVHLMNKVSQYFEEYL